MSWRRRSYRRTRLDVPGIRMSLSLGDNNLVAICECGHWSHGDSLNDAVLAWTAHVTATPACREKM